MSTEPLDSPSGHPDDAPSNTPGTRRSPGLIRRGVDFLLGELRPALAGLDWNAAVIVVVGCSALLLSRYHGTIGGYGRHLGRSLAGWPAEAVYDHLYWFLSSMGLYGVLPFVCLLLLRGEKLSEYGLGFGRWKFGLGITLISYLVMFPILLVSARSPSFAATYPLDHDALRSLSHLLAYESGYWLYFIGWEFLFRSFLLFGLHKRMGAHAIWVQLMPFVIMHAGKPELEAFASILAGVALAVLALRSRSFWYGALLHASIATTMDLLCGLPRMH